MQGKSKTEGEGFCSHCGMMAVKCFGKSWSGSDGVWWRLEHTLPLPSKYTVFIFSKIGFLWQDQAPYVSEQLAGKLALSFIERDHPQPCMLGHPYTQQSSTHQQILQPMQPWRRFPMLFESSKLGSCDRDQFSNHKSKLKVEHTEFFNDRYRLVSH